MEMDERSIGRDPEGWPIRKMTLREILKGLGAKCDSGTVRFDINDKILDKYVCLLEDDGMGYGIGEMYVSSVGSVTDDEIYMFRSAEEE